MAPPTRDQSIIESFIKLADNLVADFDVVDLLTGLSDRCVRLLGISAAGVMFSTPAGQLRLVASSSEAMQVVELFELQSQEGPCLDAFRTGLPVAHEVLRRDTSRWSSFSGVALDAGFESVCALPLRLRDTTVGALNLFNMNPTPMTDVDLIVAQGFADLATISVLQHGAMSESQRVREQLSSALASRVVIEQAKGVISERAQVNIGEAFVRLRRYARANNMLLSRVAQAAIAGTLDPAAWEVTSEAPVD